MKKILYLLIIAVILAGKESVNAFCQESEISQIETKQLTKKEERKKVRQEKKEEKERLKADKKNKKTKQTKISDEQQINDNEIIVEALKNIIKENEQDINNAVLVGVPEENAKYSSNSDSKLESATQGA